MATYQMEVIPEPKPGTAVVLIGSGEEPLPIIKGQGEGEGDADYVCGACRAVICEHVHRGHFIGLVFKCPLCGVYNLIRGT
jgi:hypothetical protein